MFREFLDDRDVFIYLLSNFLDWGGPPIYSSEASISLVDELTFKLPSKYSELADECICLFQGLSSSFGHFSVKQLQQLKSFYNSLPFQKDVVRYSEFAYLFPFENRESYGLTIFLQMGLDPSLPNREGLYLTDFMRFISINQWKLLIERRYDFTRPLHKHDALDVLVTSLILEESNKDDQLMDVLTDVDFIKVMNHSTLRLDRPGILLEIKLKELEILEPAEDTANESAHKSIESSATRPGIVVRKMLYDLKSVLDSLYPHSNVNNLIKLRKFQKRSHELNMCIKGLRDIKSISLETSWENIINVATAIGMIELPSTKESAFQTIWIKSIDAILDLDVTFSWDYLISLGRSFDLISLSTTKSQAIQQIQEGCIIYLIKNGDCSKLTWEELLKLGNDIGIVEISIDKEGVIKDIRDFIVNPTFKDHWKLPQIRVENDEASPPE